MGFVDSEEEKKRILGQPSRAHVGVTILEGPRTHHVSLYQFQDVEKAYAITASKGPLYEISPSILKPITQGAFYFQDKRLFGMEIEDVMMLEVTTPQEHYVLIKQNEEWVLEDNPSAVHHGLDSPSAIVRGRNRQGQKSGQLVLGKREKWLVFAKGAGHKGLYQVRSTILDQIPTQERLVINEDTSP